MGLILVKRGPLKILPARNPPISEPTQPNKRIKRIILGVKISKNNKKSNKRKNVAYEEDIYQITDYIFLKILFDIIKNSKIDKTPNTIKI